MTAFDIYKDFFHKRIGVNVQKPSILTIIALLTLNDIFVKGWIKVNVIPINVFDSYQNIVDKYAKEFKIKYKIIPFNIYYQLNLQPFCKHISSKNFRLDERLYMVLSNLGPLHTSFYFQLKDVAKQVLKENLDVAYSGIEKPIDFDTISQYNDSTLRPYQHDNKLEIYKLWTSQRSVMLQMPTGTGKTRLFVSIVNDICKWAKSVHQNVNILLLAHRKELISQISHNVGVTYGIPHGLIIANNDEQRQYQVQVGSVPTLNVRLDRWSQKSFDIIIVDEAHHVKASSYNKILKAFPSAKVLGVTATPCRLNGASFHPEFDSLIVSPSVSKFIKDGYLCDYDYYSIKPDSQLNKEIAAIKNFALDGDYLDSAMMEVMDRSSIRANIIQTYMKYAKGKKGIVYTINRKHNENICARFKESGVKAAAIDGTTPAKQRDDIVEKFRNGELQVLCNVNIFSEGFDCPDVEFIQLARPTKSLSLYLQQVGRGLRVSPGKEKVLFLDNVGLYNRFGFPSARRHWKHHFEGRYEHSDDDFAKNFSNEDADKDILYIDDADFEEGKENVDLLHTSIIEDPSQIDEYGYIKDFDTFINKQISKVDTASEKLSVLDLNLKELEQEERIFKKYKIEVPIEIKNRIAKLNNDIDNINKENRIIEAITDADWRKALLAVPPPFNGKTIRGVLHSVYTSGYHVHVRINKEGDVKVNLEERQYDEIINNNQQDINRQNPLDDQENGEVRRKVIKLSFTLNTTYEMLKEGLSDMEIARKRGLANSTICGHISQLIKKGIVDAYSVIDKSIYKMIYDFISENRNATLREIYDHFNGHISYNEINYVVADINKLS